MSELSSRPPVRSRREDNILLGTVHLIDADGVAATGGVPDELTAAHYRVVAYGSIQQFLDQQPDAYQPACVLLYTSSPGFLGPELHNALAKSGSRLPIVFFTTPAKSAKRSQANPLQNLLRRIERAITVFETVDGREGVTLGRMQKKLLRRFADGWPDGKIAQELGVRESLIADQRRKIMETLRVSSHSQLVAMADRLDRSRSRK